MSPLRARVEKARLVLDEPTTLPDGTVVDLVADDEGDDLTDDERFKQNYWSKWKNIYFPGDGAKRDEDSYFWILGRVDDVLPALA